VWIFVQQIPKGTSREELREFVTKGQKPSWMLLPIPSRTKIKRSEILQIFNPDTKFIEYHGLAQIDPSKAALPIIEPYIPHISETIFR
jgi:hypothetical protein